jgi:hypothetical protein
LRLVKYGRGESHRGRRIVEFRFERPHNGGDRRDYLVAMLVLDRASNVAETALEEMYGAHVDGEHPDDKIVYLCGEIGIDHLQLEKIGDASGSALRLACSHPTLVERFGSDQSLPAARARPRLHIV